MTSHFPFHSCPFNYSQAASLNSAHPDRPGFPPAKGPNAEARWAYFTARLLGAPVSTRARRSLILRRSLGTDMGGVQALYKDLAKRLLAGEEDIVSNHAVLNSAHAVFHFDLDDRFLSRTPPTTTSGRGP